MSILLDYLAKQNRPYSVTDIMTNLHNSISKPVTLKALAKLEASGAVTAKTYSKSVIYVIKQVPQSTDGSDQQAEVDQAQVLKDLEDQIMAYSANLKNLKDRK